MLCRERRHWTVSRVEALGRFLGTEDGASLLAGYRRADDVLKDEEKSSGEIYEGEEVDPALLQEPAEKELHEAISATSGEVAAAIENLDYADAVKALARLSILVEAFFDEVLVDAEDDKTIRTNRLRLLNAIREATLAVADFSKISG